MANPANNGVLVGRIGKGGIRQFENSDGSVKLVFSMGVRENFLRKGETEAKTDFIPVTAFIPAQANGIGSWANVNEGDLISIAFRLSCRPWTSKDGETHYPGATVEVDGYPVFLEPRSVTSARAAKKAAEANGTTADEAQPAAMPAAGSSEAEQIAALKAQIAAYEGAAAAPFGA